MTISRLLNSMLRTLGLEVHRYRPETTFDFSLQKLFRRAQINFVIDVGANDGAYGRFLRNVGYRGDILSFEPLPDARRELEQQARGDQHWRVGPQVALGAEAGDAVLNVSENSRSSSLMPMKESHCEAAPTSNYVATERVRVSTLDREVEDWMSDYRAAFLKLDVQGFERSVLAGAEQTLGWVEGLQVEMSTVELYEGQALFREIFDLLMSRGFSLYCLEPGLRHPETGRLLQFDAVFDAENSHGAASSVAQSG